MVTLGEVDPTEVTIKNVAGPLLDDGAPYIGIRSTELKPKSKLVCPEWHGELDPIPPSVTDQPYWQYGRGEHSSVAKKVLGSVVFAEKMDRGGIVQIRHLVIDNRTKRDDLLQHTARERDQAGPTTRS